MTEQTTLLFNTKSVYDWSRNQWTVPINAGINQLVRIGGHRVQLGAGVHFRRRPGRRSELARPPEADAGLSPGSE